MGGASNRTGETPESTSWAGTMRRVPLRGPAKEDCLTSDAWKTADLLEDPGNSGNRTTWSLQGKTTDCYRNGAPCRRRRFTVRTSFLFVIIFIFTPSIPLLGK